MAAREESVKARERELEAAVREAAAEALLVEFRVEDAQSVMQATKDVKGVIKRMSEVIKERHRPPT